MNNCQATAGRVFRVDVDLLELLRRADSREEVDSDLSDLSELSDDDSDQDTLSDLTELESDSSATPISDSRPSKRLRTANHPTSAYNLDSPLRTPPRANKPLPKRSLLPPTKAVRRTQEFVPKAPRRHQASRKKGVGRGEEPPKTLQPHPQVPIINILPSMSTSSSLAPPSDASTPPTTVPSSSSTSGKKRKPRKKKTPEQQHRRNVMKRENRREARAQFQAENNGLKRISRKRKREAEPFQLPDFDASTLPYAKGAWVARRQRFMRTQRTLQDVKEANLKVIAWDGHTTHPFLARDDRVMLLLGGMPNSEDWQSCSDRMASKIDDARRACKFTDKHLINPRSPNPAMQYGFSHGGGRLAPGVVDNSDTNTRAMESLVRDSAFIRLAGHLNAMWRNYNPWMHAHYSEVLNFLNEWDNKLITPFPNLPMAAFTVNYGPHHASYDHVDANNLPHGWCAVTPLGKFNPKLGGHLVLWDLGLAIEFPPGATIWLPSALLVHSNVAIQQGETRYSVTSYSAGGLFRWAFRGCQTEESWESNATQEDRDAWKTDREARLKDCLMYFPVWNA